MKHKESSNFKYSEELQKKLLVYKKEVVDTWIDPDEDAESALERYKTLSDIMQPMYDLVLSYSNYYSIRKDYGSGVQLTMIEMHILQDLTEAESQTVSSLAEKWKRTPSAISQIIRKLEDKGLLERLQNKDDRKSYNLILTSLGEQTVLAHSRYDNIDIVKTHKKLFKKYSLEDMAIFFSICESYNQLLEDSTKG